MRHLLLLRHAKAARPEGVRDHDRPLTGRGRRDAELMGRFLTAAEGAPGLIVTSTAERARATAELAKEAGAWRAAVRETPALYEATTERALDIVRSLERSRETVMLVGHEPTWSTLATLLVGGGQLRLPTAGLAHVAFDCADWAEVGPRAGVLYALIIPALLRGKR
jgi:phosphohistidine phosphatase